jgi:hypothetical protein
MKAQQQRMDDEKAQQQGRAYDTELKAQQQRMDYEKAQQQRNSAPRGGITMGAGYANRPFD